MKYFFNTFHLFFAKKKRWSQKKRVSLERRFVEESILPFLYQREKVEPKERSYSRTEISVKSTAAAPFWALPRCYFKREKALCLLQMILFNQLLHMFRAVDRDDIVVDNDAGHASAVLFADFLAGVRGIANFEKLF